MKRLTLTFLAAAVVALCIAPSAGAFAFNSLDDTFTNQDGSPATQAGSHPFAQTTTLGFDTIPDPNGGVDIPDGDLKDMTVSLPPGFVGDPTVIPTCSGARVRQRKMPRRNPGRLQRRHRHRPRTGLPRPRLQPRPAPGDPGQARLPRGQGAGHDRPQGQRRPSLQRPRRPSQHPQRGHLLPLGPERLGSSRQPCPRCRTRLLGPLQTEPARKALPHPAARLRGTLADQLRGGLLG